MEETNSTQTKRQHNSRNTVSYANDYKNDVFYVHTRKLSRDKGNNCSNKEYVIYFNPEKYTCNLKVRVYHNYSNHILDYNAPYKIVRTTTTDDNFASYSYNLYRQDYQHCWTFLKKFYDNRLLPAYDMLKMMHFLGGF